jgi:hypothetical protein
MCSTALILQPATIAATSLSRAACYDKSLPVDEKHQTEFRPVHINWVVATDANGKRRLQMHWRGN